MTAPKFKRPTSTASKEWSNADLDRLQLQVDACMDFCERANDYMHEEGDDQEDSPEEKVMKELFADLAKDELKKRMKKKG